MKFIAILLTALFSLSAFGQEKFPDGTPIPEWFRDTKIVSIEALGNKYNLADYGVVNAAPSCKRRRYRLSSTGPHGTAAVSSSFRKAPI